LSASSRRPKNASFQFTHRLNRRTIESRPDREGSRIHPWQCAVGLHSNYKNLLAVEDAFCQLKSYLEVRPVFHWRPDRVRNHVRLCFIAYWLCARLGNEWRAKGEKGEVQRLLRQLQAIRVGTLKIAGQDLKRLLTQMRHQTNFLINHNARSRRSSRRLLSGLD
jgi:transposase